MPGYDMTRRAAIGAALASVATTKSRADDTAALTNEDFIFEITRSDAEWRRFLGDERYYVMREVGTEWARSSELWDRYGAATYSCAGCDLKVYDEKQRRPLDKGWVFFHHAEPRSVLMSIDRVSPTAYGGSGMEEEGKELIEVQCRRCGCHLGHILYLEGGIVHCINGIALTLQEI
ncbi:Peptide methionine sulfoxide reductase MsrB [Roseivivax jejudonensis]|uniref:peptide-methionine (R)-S-oxide reductase n=1 Tax=Roseivivax jejudonensis TaxID=1529041 RepID=A0A1X6Y6J4_9RHOB|nr:peptide-methionine (R)-S-oxide reductase [Roseivivax jejudonensis]SLN10397.1 Peptide methionine sulfoxide reductase MsrB [Roseivivax jejudonensis]